MRYVSIKPVPILEKMLNRHYHVHFQNHQMELYNIVNYTVEHISTGVKKISVGLINNKASGSTPCLISNIVLKMNRLILFLHTPPPPSPMPISPFLSKSPTAKFNATSAGGMQLAALCVCPPPQ